MVLGRQGVAVAAFATLAALPLQVLAHPGHAHKILGTVTSFTATSVEVLDRGNEKTTFAITKDTKIRVGKNAFGAVTMQLPERPAQEEGR